jgi:hypothetical protein
VFQITDHRIPFGGHSGGGSGYGAYHGEAGFREFTNDRATFAHHTSSDPDSKYAPYDDAIIPLLRNLMINLTPYFKIAATIALVSWSLKKKQWAA